MKNTFKILVTLLIGVLALSQAGYGQDRAKVELNPFAPPRTAAKTSSSNSPIEYEWTPKKYLEAVKLLDQGYKVENTFSKDVTDKYELLLSLKAHYVSGTAPIEGFSHLNIAHLKLIPQLPSLPGNKLIITFSDQKNKKISKKIRRLLGHLVELDSTENGLPKLSNEAVGELLLGSISANLTAMHHELQDSAWKPLANKAAVVTLTAEIYLMEVLEKKYKKLSDVFSFITGTVLVGGLTATLFVAGFPGDMTPSSFELSIGFASVAAATLGALLISDRIQLASNSEQNKAQYRKKLLFLALETAKINGYAWKDRVGIPNIAHLTACGLKL